VGVGTLHGVEADVDTPRLPDFSLEQKVNYELEILDCPLSAHPAELVRRTSGQDGLTEASELQRRLGQHVRMIGILDTTRGTLTKNDELMQFLTLEDETGVFEVTLFPKLYRKVRRRLTDGGPYLVEGKVDEQYDSISVTAQRVERFGDTAR
ncbi:MAG TPA: OB-fold nucleic acid binding domain-containing protein, partial [Planctomycetota bacterium]|nr:OB-fold nucleic acid binding domain-containing protein [Planctomycetota bacterium]